MERITVGGFGAEPVPVSKRLKRAMGEEEAEKKIAEALSNDGALVLGWAEECFARDTGYLQDKEFHLDDLPQAVRPNIMRMLAMRFIEVQEGIG